MKIIFSAVAFLFLFNLTGCYTVIWTPGMDSTIPSDTYAYDDSSYYSADSEYADSTGSVSSFNENPSPNIAVTSDFFYDPYYYGGYTQYYYHPWWLSYTKQINKNTQKKEVDRTGSSTGVLRNSGEGRGDYGRNAGSSTGSIINNALPTVTTSGSGSTSTGSTPSSGSGTTTKTRETTTTNNSDNNSSSRSSGSGSVRNNDGNRNDGGRK